MYQSLAGSWIFKIKNYVCSSSLPSFVNRRAIYFGPQLRSSLEKGPPPFSVSFHGILYLLVCFPRLSFSMSSTQIGEEMSQNSFIKQYLEKQQELLRQRLEREAREAAELEGKPRLSLLTRSSSCLFLSLSRWACFTRQFQEYKSGWDCQLFALVVYGAKWVTIYLLSGKKTLNLTVLTRRGFLPTGRVISKLSYPLDEQEPYLREFFSMDSALFSIYSVSVTLPDLLHSSTYSHMLSPSLPPCPDPICTLQKLQLSRRTRWSIPREWLPCCLLTFRAAWRDQSWSSADIHPVRISLPTALFCQSCVVGGGR